MDKISVLIPVYRESHLLRGLLTDLLSDPYLPKEIYVIIDEPTEASLYLTEEFKDRVIFTLNKIRIGKANALNDAVKRTKGDILLFLDSDVELQKNGESFLSLLNREMKEINIMDNERLN